MKTISLTQGKVAKVDDDDFNRIAKFNWFAQLDPRRGIYYAARKYRKVDGKQGVIYLHREVLDVRERSVKVDHRNHDELDCQKHNLRKCSNSKNLMNRRGLDAHNTSGMRGVSWAKDRGLWRASIGLKNKIINLGYFKDKTSASAAYADANKKYFGEFGGKI